jgi:hypothetical protein
MFPIRIWQEDEDSLNDLKKVLNKFTPNSEYDQKEENISSDFSIRSSEIFEYFTSTSKYQKIDNIENTRKVLIKEGIIENIPDEILQKQIEFISNFLSNILK